LPGRNRPLIGAVPRLGIPVQVRRQAHSVALHGWTPLRGVAGRATRGGAALFCRWATLHGRALASPLLQLRAAAPQALTQSSSRSAGAHLLPEPVSSFRRKIPKRFARLEKLTRFRPGRFLPASIPDLPSIAGISVNLAVAARIHVTAPPLVDEALAR
jgi:hypothetical protein